LVLGDTDYAVVIRVFGIEASERGNFRLRLGHGTSAIEEPIEHTAAAAATTHLSRSRIRLGSGERSVMVGIEPLEHLIGKLLGLCPAHILGPAAVVLAMGRVLGKRRR
jgi:hypothetical protein